MSINETCGWFVVLNSEEIKQFDCDGYVSPISILSHKEVGKLRQKLETIEAVQNGALYPAQRNKSFLLFKWLNDLTRDTRILEPVSQLIGPDILLWNTLFWIKEAGAKNLFRGTKILSIGVFPVKKSSQLGLPCPLLASMLDVCGLCPAPTKVIFYRIKTATTMTICLPEAKRSTLI